MEPQNLIHKRVGSYEIIKEIASDGGFANVFLGKHNIFLDKPPVAIKILHRHLLNSENEQLRFIREARILQVLKHQYILPIIDANIEDNHQSVYLITEYASEGSLKDLLKQHSPHPLAINDALRILYQVGLALQHAHQMKIIHRDLKPGNILFKSKEQALLADFGIAVEIEHSGLQPADFVGTPAYMAPEQFKGKVSISSDLYSLGCIAYELFTNHRPFSDDQYKTVEWENLHKFERPTPPSLLNPGLPDKLEKAILKAIAKDINDRHKSIAEFLDALGIPIDPDQQKTQQAAASEQMESIAQINATPLMDVKSKIPDTSFHFPFQNDVEHYLKEGHALVEQEKLEEALNAFEQATRLDSKSAQAFYQIGEVLKQQERFMEAQAAYDQAIDLNTKFTDAYIGKGDIEFAFKKYDKALKYYQTAAKFDLNSARAYYKIGEAYIKLEHIQEALSANESALRRDRYSIDFNQQRIKILRQLELYSEALKLYDKIIQHQPGQVNFYLGKADLLTYLGRYDEAIETYNSIIKYAPEFTDPYHNKIDLLKRENRNDEALATFDQLLLHTPDPITTFSDKAALLIRLNRIDEALLVYDQMALRSSNPIKAYNKQIELLENHLRYDEIIAIYDKIIPIASNKIGIYEKKIELLLMYNRVDEALKVYDLMVPLASDPLDIYDNKIALLLEYDRLDEALKVYDLMVRIAPDPLDIYDNKIALLLEYDRLDEALKVYDLMVPLSPNPIKIYYQKIDLLKQNKRLSETLNIYDLMVPLAFDPVEIYDEKIVILKKLNREEQILATYNQILQHNPNSTNTYQQKIALLEKLNRYEEALNTTQQLIQLHPIETDAYFKMADLLQKLNLDQEVITTYDTIIQLNANVADNAKACYKKGKILKKAGPINTQYYPIPDSYTPHWAKPYLARLFPNPDYVKALLEFEKAYRQVPTNTTYRFSLESTLRELGKDHEANNIGRNYRTWRDQHADLLWLSLFNMINVVLISLIVGVMYSSWGIFALIFLAGSGLTGTIAYSQNEHAGPHNLDNIFHLFLPFLFFSAGWSYAGAKFSSSPLALLVIFLATFLVNTFAALSLDIYGIIVYKKMLQALRSKFLDLLLYSKRFISSLGDFF